MAVEGLPFISDIESRLREEGYISDRHFDQIDTPIAQATACPIDGTNRDYRGFTRPAGPGQMASYRAFAVCKGFGHAEEF